ncbi:hypothetical protein PI95_033450, partial [Hassallia byssoidea VB512170]|nr:hypothetical protein [Hassalia byssoidea VB512170]
NGGRLRTALAPLVHARRLNGGRLRTALAPLVPHSPIPHYPFPIPHYPFPITKENCR